MSASAFVGPFTRRARRDHMAAPSPADATNPPPEGRDLYRRRSASRWLGSAGEQLRLRVHVEEVREATGHLLTFLARVDATDDLVEWTMPRRHRIRVGDRLALSGLVKAHTTRHDTPVTLLRDCFNPLRMT